MKKLFLFVALFTWIGFSASAQVTRDTTTTETQTDSGTRTDSNSSTDSNSDTRTDSDTQANPGTQTDSDTQTDSKMDPRLDNTDPQLDNMRVDHPQIDNSGKDSMKHYWVFRDGKVMEVKDGKEQEMTTETQVNDVWIRTNGQVVMKNDEVVDLKEGQYLDKQGKIHDKKKERK